MAATGRFAFDLMGPLIRQLDESFSRLSPEPLSPANLSALSTSPGVYQLWHQGSRVYVGKAERDLQGRLQGHHRKIAARTNIIVADMSFVALYLEATWIPVGAERGLIDLYDGPHGHHLLPWNNNGFGNNDPGKERDTSRFGLNHFDNLYPADLDIAVSGVAVGTYPIHELLRVMKRELPYVFRFENHRSRHADYLASNAVVTQEQPTARELFAAIATGLPAGWQITALPGYVIMYKSQRPFPSARDTWTS